jgi:hypothetical protein
MIISTNTYTHIRDPTKSKCNRQPGLNIKNVNQNNSILKGIRDVSPNFKIVENTQKHKSKIGGTPTLTHMSPRNIDDSLFWCFSQIVNSDCDKTNTRLKKIQYVDELTPIYTTLRKRFSLVAFSSVTNFLAYEKTININTFLALCAYKQINVCVICLNSHFVCESAPGVEDYYIIRLNSNKAFSYTKIIRNDLSAYTNKSIPICLDRTTLKPASTYTAKQLKEYAERIDVSLINPKTGKPKIKQDLYKSLLHAVSKSTF